MGGKLTKKCKICRREQQKLYLKGERCFSDKCTFNRKQNYPGKAAYFRTRLSNYGVRLREKQKVKRVYGLTESQMKRFFRKAVKAGGNKGLKLLQLLEMRLDNVVYLMGLAPSRAAARQLVSHGKISVNGKKIDVPSHITSVGDEIKLRDKKTQPKTVAELKTPAWVKKKARGGVVESEPTREMIDEGIRENLIVEFYSR